MRQKLEFPKLPPDEHLPGGTVVSKKGKVKARNDLIAPKHHVEMVHTVAKQLRPEIVTRMMEVFGGADPSLAGEVASLLKCTGSAPLIRYGYFYYVAVHEGKRIAQLYKDDRLLASGCTVELFIYAMKHHPGAARVIMSEIRANSECYIPMASHVDAEQITELLLAYRQARSCSTGLDKITKLAQLPSVDYDHVCLKFEHASFYSDAGGDVQIVHPGAGPLGGTHLIFEQPVVLVDPAIVSEGVGYDTYVKEKYDVAKSAKFDVVVSDVAGGSTYGMVPGTTVREAPDGSYLKLDLQDTAGPKGRVVRKPRPHNTEVIWVVSATGDRWEVKRKELLADVIQANENRMANYFQQIGTVRKMAYAMTAERVTQIKERAYRVPQRQHGYKLEPGAMPYARSPRLKTRLAQFRAAVRQFSLQDYEKTCAAPGHFCDLGRGFLRAGNLERLDCGLGSVRFALRSAVVTARLHDWQLFKTQSGWLVCPPGVSPDTLVKSKAN